MTINPLSAANAYRSQLKLMNGMGDTGASADQSLKPSFANMVENALHDATQTQSNSEQLQIQSMTGAGKVELSDLVTAVANAELSLNTVVAVRDRVINAYNEIIKMAI